MVKPDPKKYRVELGINLHAATVPQTNPNLRIFPLQNALVDITAGDLDDATPAWYSRLRVGDEISFRLVDISRLRVPETEPDYPSFALAQFYFGNPTTGQSANPFTENVIEWRFSDRLEDRPSPVYSLAPDHHLPTWDLVGRNAAEEEFESLHFADIATRCEGSDDENVRFRAFELTVVIRMMRDGWVNHYVFDPEMIVSETDSEGDGGGGKGGKGADRS